MSLLLNDEFTLYKLRLGYLNQTHDGVGERLITLNTSVLNEPAFRAAGWAPDASAIKRCYSPPIPTTGAADYFSRPARARQDGVSLVDTPDEGSGGLISGHRGAEDVIAHSTLVEKERQRRKQVAKVEEDDSSDLSDDSEEEETPAQGVRFAPGSMRPRANTSPRRDAGAGRDGPEVKIISPSFRPRTSSLGATEAIHAANARTTRPRRDTTTSSEMSSDSEALGASLNFRRKLPSRPQKSAMLSEKIAEEDPDDSALEGEDDDEEEEEEEDVEVAEASDISDEFEGEDNPGTASPELPGIDIADESAERNPPPNVPPPVMPHHTRKKSQTGSKDEVPKLPKLPPGRPISTTQGISLLSLGLKGPGSGASTSIPYQKYAELSGKGEAQPLWIKIFAPFSEQAEDPLEVPLRRVKSAAGGAPVVEDLIGLALWCYHEAGYKPVLSGRDGIVGNWELRMVEDGEVDMDFPALTRSRNVTDFTSNNNRPPQRRARDKPWDEFGLVRAEVGGSPDSGSDVANLESPGPTQPLPVAASVAASVQIPPNTGPPPAAPSQIPSRNPITGPSFALTNGLRKDTTNLIYAPQTTATTSTPRTGAAKTISIHFTDPQSFQTTVTPIPTTTDTYIAELFDIACARLRLDKALYVLKVRGTQTVAPSDRTVEALGEKLHLDLVRRRFGAVGDFGLGLSGSPGSSSPNAPLELVPNTPPTGRDGKRRRGLGVLNTGGGGGVHKTIMNNATAASLMDVTGAGPIGRRYDVQRKLPLSFSGSHPRILIITPEYMQILPAVAGVDPGGPGHVGQGKVTNVPMSSIVGVKVSRKHPKMLRVLVYRERETKRYDFECSSHQEAQSIMADIRVGLAEYGVQGDE